MSAADHVGPSTEARFDLGDLPVAAFVLDDDGVVVAANDHADALFGAEARELLATLHPDDRSTLVTCAADGGGTVLGRSLIGPPRRFFSLSVGRVGDGTTLVVAHETTEQHRLDAALAEVATGVYTTNAALRGGWMSRRTGQELGIPPEFFDGIDVYALIHPDDRDRTHHLVSQALATPGMKFADSVRVVHPELPGVYWAIVAWVTWLPDDDPLGGLLVRFDAGLAADLHQDAAASDRPGTVTLGDASPLGFLNLTIDGALVQRSTRVREILRPVGIADDCSNWLDCVTPADLLKVEQSLANARLGHSRGPVEVGFSNGDEMVWVRLDVIAYRDDRGEVAGMFVNFLDITDDRVSRDALAEAREELWHLANHDPLTGLCNRLLFNERLATALEGLARTSVGIQVTGGQPAVLVCDLDGFKEVNDRYGHRVGDAVLVEAARRLERAVRAGDTVCRFGGDEFFVLCSRVDDRDELAAIAERIVAAFTESTIVDDRPVEVGVSVGASLAWPDDAEDPDTILLRADRAMYTAKAAGRGQALLG